MLNVELEDSRKPSRAETFSVRAFRQLISAPAESLEYFARHALLGSRTTTLLHDGNYFLPVKIDSRSRRTANVAGNRARFEIAKRN